MRSIFQGCGGQCAENAVMWKDLPGTARQLSKARLQLDMGLSSSESELHVRLCAGPELFEDTVPKEHLECEFILQRACNQTERGNGSKSVRRNAHHHVCKNVDCV